MAAFFGKKCPDCGGASTSFTLAASVATNNGDDCHGEAHITESARVKICQPGHWHGILSISGYDCCDNVSVVLTNADDTYQTTLANLGSSSSSTSFSFFIDCSSCLAESYVKVISSDGDGCSDGWTGTATFAAGTPPP